MSDASAPEDLVAALLSWYADAQRVLPWRSDPSPYHVLLSELMLQQTRVETVVPYFERFLARWPTIDALAAADEQDVLGLWAGLGYYSRARNLLACARAASAQGGLPETVEALRALPGIGPYTAGAVASIAFGRREPVVDGNVERVICRLDRREEDPRRAGRAGIWGRCRALHAALPDDAHPGDLNQALMELGATVCLPRNPRCAQCPWASSCLSLRGGDVERLPARPPRVAPVSVSAVAVLTSAQGGLVLGQRPSTGLLAGLWEPIGGDIDDRAFAADAAVHFARERAGLEIAGLVPLGEVVHVFTHRRLTTTVFRAETVGGALRAGHFYQEVRALPDPGAVPLSTLAKRVLARATAPDLPLPLSPR